MKWLVIFYTCSCVVGFGGSKVEKKTNYRPYHAEMSAKAEYSARLTDYALDPDIFCQRPEIYEVKESTN